MALEIHPLHLGTMHDFHCSAIHFQRGFDEKMDVALIMFVILGGDAPIVVDTGGLDEHTTKEQHGFNLVRPPEQEPLAQLQRLGVDPADVKMVVNTHLHWDHCSNNDLFPNANIYVQRSEMAYAIAPMESNRVAFDNTRDLTPTWLSTLGQMRPVDGDKTIAPGVRLIHLPGHTPGSQGVLVDVESKRYLLAGDFVDTAKNWEGDERNSHIPSGAFVDLIAYWGSFNKVEELDCEVVPSHDLAVLEKGVLR